MARFRSDRGQSVKEFPLTQFHGTLGGIPDALIARRIDVAEPQLMSCGRGLLDSVDATGHLDKQVGARKALPVPVPVRSTVHAPVASSSLSISFLGVDYLAIAWQPQGGRAFIYLIRTKDQHWVQPEIAEGRDLAEALDNAVDFIERVLARAGQV